MNEASNLHACGTSHDTPQDADCGAANRTAAAQTCSGLPPLFTSFRREVHVMCLQDADRGAADGGAEALHGGGRHLRVLAAGVGPAPHQPVPLQVRSRTSTEECCEVAACRCWLHVQTPAPHPPLLPQTATSGESPIEMFGCKVHLIGCSWVPAAPARLVFAGRRRDGLCSPSFSKLRPHDSSEIA